MGPDINIRVVPLGNLETDFRSEFSSSGINQTRHRIYIQVKAYISIILPLMEKKTELTTTVPVAETIIVGEVPEVFMQNN